MGFEVQEVDATVPRGPNAAAIQVLSPVETTVVQATIAAGNDRQTLPTGAEIVEVNCDDDCRFAFGDSGVDATAGTKRLLPPGSYIYRVPSGATHFAVTQVGSSAGFVTVARMR